MSSWCPTEENTPCPFGIYPATGPMLGTAEKVCSCWPDCWPGSWLGCWMRMLDQDAGCIAEPLRHWALPSPTCRGQSAHAVTRPTVAAPNLVERGARLLSLSYVTTSFFSLLFFSSPPFPLSTSLMHTHARTRARTHTHTHTRIHVRPRVHELILPMAGRLGGIISP